MSFKDLLKKATENPTVKAFTAAAAEKATVVGKAATELANKANDALDKGIEVAIIKTDAALDTAGKVVDTKLQQAAQVVDAARKAAVAEYQKTSQGTQAEAPKAPEAPVAPAAPVAPEAPKAAAAPKKAKAAKKPSAGK